jgi:DNA helicase-2/ATP-dependent DNA helicase PcrA
VHEVYLYEDGREWVVRSGADEQRFADRPAAFAAAKAVLRANAPSALVTAAPGPPPSSADPIDAPVPSAPPHEQPADGSRRRSPPSTSPGSASAHAAHKPAPAAGTIDWDRLQGPAALGRSLVIPAGADVPDAWAGAPRVVLDDETDLDEVRAAFLARRPVVFEVAGAGPDERGETWTGDVWAVPVDFELRAEAASTLALLNAVDARDPQAPSWPWAARAVAAGARPAGAGPDAQPVDGDVVLPDGRPVWCDGGPFRIWGPTELGSATPVLPRVAVELGSLTPPRPDVPTADLAADQLAAVAEPGGTARIIAPAGSGKTRVLTERARYLLATARIPPRALTLVAFNKRAQLEMRERTTDLPGLQVQTLNALALAILNGTGGFRPRGTTVSTIDEAQVRRLIGDLVRFPRRTNVDPAAAWIDALSAVRLGLRDPARVEADFRGDVDGLAELFPTYRRALRRAGVVDFDEQIYLAVEALLTEPDTRGQAQRQCRLLLVDEFQDLTPAHLLLVRLLAGADLDVFGVGDDDQTIYGYSGASPAWLVDFDRYFPGAVHHALEVNYRCPVPVVSSAANLLSHNRQRVPKTITAGPGNPADPDALATIVVDDPVRVTVDRVEALVGDGVAPTDIAVLTRVNTLLAPIQVALHLRGIPARNREGARFAERTGVAAALSWLRMAVSDSRLSPADVERAARRPGRSLSPKVIEWMAEQGDLRGLERLAGRLSTERDADKVRGFAADVARLRGRADGATTAALLELVRSGIGLDAAMVTLDAGRRGRNTAGHSDDLRALLALGRLHDDPATFSRWLTDALAESGDEGVALATVHRVKGLEWPHVIVHDATQGVFPHRLSLDVEEERRVFHVAVTRGQRTVTVVADDAEPSMFLGELTALAPPIPPTDRRDAAGPSRPATAASTRPTAAAGPKEVPAGVGLRLTWGGYDGEVTAVEPGEVVLGVGRAVFRIPIGSSVLVDGRSRTLAAPARASTRASTRSGSAPIDEGDADQGVLAALKAWRLERAKVDAVPAYVVATDRTLVEVATTLPATPAELMSVNGIGPAKLERYGDELLAVVDTARP